MPNMVSVEPKHVRKVPRKPEPPHDRLHNIKDGDCGCTCPRCWYEWTTTKYGTSDKITVGLCICSDCPCPVDGRKLLTPFGYAPTATVA